ncbi:MAG: hypothetical protein KBT47_07725 [Armatimonadetes bacterium]|nr:hypothetical protein [Candidatus Hippobium faecium]
MLGNILVYSPMNWQVFQRQDRETGYIDFNGGCKNVSKIEISITGKNYKQEDVEITKEIAVNPLGSFNERLEVPAGGWYKVSIDYTTPKGVRNYTAEHVGVGEVIVGAGQSNSTNCGQYRTNQTSGMASATDGTFWCPANDPIIGVHDKTPLGSLYPSLGDILYKEFNVPIGFASTGWGGTNTKQWMPNAMPLFEDTNVNTKINLFDYFAKRILWLGKNGFRCVIWHQGESDCGDAPDEYFMRMCQIIESSRSCASWYIPWFIAKATFCPPNTFDENVRRDQEKLITEGVVFRGPDTDTLLGDYRDFDGEGIHFSPKGLKKHAEMWAEYLIPFIHSQID